MFDLKESILLEMGMVVLEELLCLKNSICLFIIRNQNKKFYIRDLREYDRDDAYLKDTCLLEQDVYIDMMKYLLDKKIEIFSKHEDEMIL